MKQKVVLSISNRQNIKTIKRKHMNKISSNLNPEFDKLISL